LEQNPAGIHCILELYGCPPGRLNDENFVRQAVSQAAAKSMSTLLNLSSHHFEPQGVTAVALLAESHISIHTWPEHGYAAVDAFTCGTTSDPHAACDFLAEQLGAQRHQLLMLPRGNGQLGKQANQINTLEERNLCPAQN